MVAFAAVGVLVKVSAVEVTQAVLVRGKVGGHPIQDDADAVLMELIDEVHEVLRRAIAARGRKVAGGLVPPGTVEGVLHERQELHVGEPISSTY